MAHIEPRSENTYRIIVSVGYDSHGKKRRKSKTITLPSGMTERQKEKELNRQAVLFEQEVETGQYLDGANVTFAAFAKRWREDYAEKQLAPGTLVKYIMRLEERILPAIGHIKLSKLQPHHLMEFYNNLAEEGVRLDARYTPTPALIGLLAEMPTRSIVDLSGLTFKTCQRIKSGSPTTQKAAEKMSDALGRDIKKLFIRDDSKTLSDHTIRHHHGIISSILSKSVKWGAWLSNPASRVDLGKVAKYKPAYYDDDQMIDMLVALENEPLRYKAAVFIALDTGMRSGEVTGLRWSDLNLDKEAVSISKQRQYVPGYGIIICDPKTESGFRTVTLSKAAANLLRQYKKKQIEDMLKLGIAWGNDCYVFVHEDGTPFHPQRPYKWFTTFLGRHSLPKITFHQLRHTNASLLIAAGEDIVTLSGRLGHAGKNVTTELYAHIIKSKEAQAANRMDMLYSRTAFHEAKNGQ